LLHCPTDKILTDATMSNPVLRTPFGEVELRPAASRQGTSSMRVYVLLPDLDELLGVPGFGLRDPIRMRIPRTAPAAPLLH
jgi:hypothetical protein